MNLLVNGERTSDFLLGDLAVLVDVPANVGLWMGQVLDQHIANGADRRER